jgi:hypothetical protein
MGQPSGLKAITMPKWMKPSENKLIYPKNNAYGAGIAQNKAERHGSRSDTVNAPTLLTGRVLNVEVVGDKGR